jgi:hypothetical protein
MTPINVDALPAAPWKNGSGLTRTIALSPPDADLENFDWRISVAEVASSSDFSRFPGFDRTILLLDGAGMILEIAGRAISLTTPFEPHTFSGDDAVRVQLVNGPTRDFNVMTRRGRAHAEVHVWQSEFHSQITADTAVFFCARGVCRLNTAELRAGFVLRVERHNAPFSSHHNHWTRY